MRHQLTLVVLALISARIATCVADESPLTVVLAYSANDPLCHEANTILNGQPADTFWSVTNWGNLFGKSTLQDVPATPDAQGPRPYNHLQHVTLDIDSDGVADEVFVWYDLFQSIDWYHLHFTTKASYSEAIKAKRLATAIRAWPSTNPSTTVTFTNGQYAVPTELALWKRHDATFVVLKEYGFGKADYSFGTNLFVARVPKDAPAVPELDGQNAKVAMELLCKFQ